MKVITLKNLKEIEPYTNKMGFKFKIHTEKEIEELSYISSFEICSPKARTFNVSGIGYREVIDVTQIIITKKENRITKQSKLKIQDLDLDDLKRYNPLNPVHDKFFELALNDSTLYDGEAFYLSQLYPNNLSGIEKLSELAEQGEEYAMNVLEQYFRDHGCGWVNEWSDKLYLLRKAKSIVKKQGIEAYKEKEKKNQEAFIEKKQKEKELKAEKDRLYKELGFRVPLNLMKGK